MVDDVKNLYLRKSCFRNGIMKRKIWKILFMVFVWWLRLFMWKWRLIKFLFRKGWISNCLMSWKKFLKGKIISCSLFWLKNWILLFVIIIRVLLFLFCWWFIRILKYWLISGWVKERSCVFLYLIELLMFGILEGLYVW